MGDGAGPDGRGAARRDLAVRAAAAAAAGLLPQSPIAPLCRRRLESSFEERVASVRDAVAEQWAERLRLARQASATREPELRRKLQEQAAASDSAMRAAEERAEKDQEALRERLRGHVLAEVEGAAETFAGLYKKAAAHVREKIRVRSWDDRVKQLMDEKEDLQRQLACVPPPLTRWALASH